MEKENNKYEIHKDLVKYEKDFNKKIDNFFKSNRENNTIFLNADYGWGKTTFIKNNLKVEENNIYSPWLNKSSNYLEEIYCTLYNKSKSNINLIYLFIIFIFTLFSITFSSFISILIEINKDNYTICKLSKLKFICSSENNLNYILIGLIIFNILLILIMCFILFRKKPIILINIFNKSNNKHYDEVLISKIEKKINNVLVIEDIDRCDDIEDILISVDKISKYLNKNNIKKYVLVTGDYQRCINRINRNKVTDDFDKYANDGENILEKVVELRTDFLSIESRIANVLEEENVNLDIKQIEKDEIINFIKTKSLSVRFFVKFIKSRKKYILNGESIFHQLMDYYCYEKLFHINNNPKESMFDNNIFPKALNDLELLLQKGEVTINEYKYNLNNIDYNDLDIFTLKLYKLLQEDDNEDRKYIIHFYKEDTIPILDEDYDKDKSTLFPVGKSYPDKNKLDRYLLGYDIKGNEPYYGKRCYFENAIDNYIISYTSEYIDILGLNRFIPAYIGAFFRKNRKELQLNYPCLYNLLEKTPDKYRSSNSIDVIEAN